MDDPKSAATRVLVTGASGQLGPYVVGRLAADGHRVTAWSGQTRGTCFGVPLRPVDLGSADATALGFRDAAPEVVVHLAAVSSVAEAYRNPDRAAAVNTKATKHLAELCDERGSRLIYLSTDLVFDGRGAPYREADKPKPLSVYGAAKLAGEAAVHAAPRALVLRLSLLFGPSLTGRATFFDQQLAALREGRMIRLFNDEWRTPLSLAIAADAIAAAVRSEETGLLHLGGPQRLSRWEMGTLLAEQIGADPSVLIPTSRLEGGDELRPRDTSLDSRRWRDRFAHVRLPGYSESVQMLLTDMTGDLRRT